MNEQEFMIREIKTPLKQDYENDLHWLCESLGFISNRDFEKTGAKIFCSIVRSNSHGIKSEEIAKECKITKGNVIHHLSKYIKAGIVIRDKNKYYLRSRSIEKSLDEMQLDLLRTLQKIRTIAKEVDKELGYIER